MDSSDNSNPNFFKHVFSLDDDSKANIYNIVQYALLAIIPVVILNKTMQRFVPEADEEKGNLEILAEIIIQVISMFLGLLIIHRIIIYVPTFSKASYPDFNIIFIILAVLMITMSLQTKLGEKTNIIVDRLNDLWNGTTSGNNNKKGKNNKKGNVRVSQPVSGNNQQMQMSQQSYADGTSINSLPTQDLALSSQSMNATQQLPNYNKMYVQDTTPLIGASTPGPMSEGFEPVAASEAIGGFSSFGGGW